MTPCCRLWVTCASLGPHYCSSSVNESVDKMSVTFSFNVFLSNDAKKKKRNLNCFTFNSWIKYKNARVNFDHFWWNKVSLSFNQSIRIQRSPNNCFRQPKRSSQLKSTPCTAKNSFCVITFEKNYFANIFEPPFKLNWPAVKVALLKEMKKVGPFRCQLLKRWVSQLASIKFTSIHFLHLLGRFEFI